MGWHALEQWGEDARRVAPLTGGVANEVWQVEIGGRVAVGRLGSRSADDLAWEMDLLRFLDTRGLAVPVPIPTTDGRLFVDGLVVMSYLEGEPPETEADWRRVAATLRRLHELTVGWPQRPGWRSSQDLRTAETGTSSCPTTAPASTNTRSTSPPKRQPPGRRPCAGATTPPPAASPRSDQPGPTPDSCTIWCTVPPVSNGGQR